MTFEEVKKAFFRYDGSLFAMAREEKEAYESYKLLNIPEEMAEAVSYTHLTLPTIA